MKPTMTQSQLLPGGGVTICTLSAMPTASSLRRLAQHVAAVPGVVRASVEEPLSLRQKCLLACEDHHLQPCC
jgi:hypothetical protein